MAWIPNKSYRQTYTITVSEVKSNITIHIPLTRDGINGIDAQFTNIICYLSNNNFANISILPSYSRPRAISIDQNYNITYGNDGDLFIKITSLPIGTTYINVYSGGYITYTQDIANGFIIGDTFDSTFDYTKWVRVKGKVSIVSSLLKLLNYNGGTLVYSKTTYGPNVEIFGEMIINAGQTGQVGFGNTVYIDSGSGGNVLISIEGDGAHARVNGGSVTLNEILDASVIGIKRFVIRMLGDSNSFTFGSITQTVTGNSRTGIRVKMGGGFRKSGIISNGEMVFNWIGIANTMSENYSLNYTAGWHITYTGINAIGYEVTFILTQQSGPDVQLLKFPTWDFGDGNTDSTTSVITYDIMNRRVYEVKHIYGWYGKFTVLCYNLDIPMNVSYDILIMGTPSFTLNVDSNTHQLPICLGNIANIIVDSTPALAPTNYKWEISDNTGSFHEVDNKVVPTYIIPNTPSYAYIIPNTPGYAARLYIRCSVYNSLLPELIKILYKQTGEFINSIELSTNIHSIQNSNYPISGIDEFGRMEYQYEIDEMGNVPVIDIPGNYDWAGTGFLVNRNVNIFVGFTIKIVILLRTGIHNVVRRLRI